jgi:periplasmic protein TonB
MFDTALIESAAHHGVVQSRAAKSLPLAIAFHAAVIGALVFSALASTADPPEPVIPIAFPSFGGPPPPPPAGGPKPIPVVLPPRTAKLDTPVIRIPENPPDPVTHTTPAQEDAVDGSNGGGSSSETGEPGGERDGVAGGIPNSTGTGTGSDPGAGDEAILQPGVGGVTHPEILERVDPDYPEAMRRAHVQGTVILEAVITAAGTVDEIRIVASGGPMLDAAASAAVLRWRYKPATLNGRAVAVRLTVTVRFGLTG